MDALLMGELVEVNGCLRVIAKSLETATSLSGLPILRDP